MKLFKILIVLVAIIGLVGLTGCGEKDKPAKKEEPATTEAVVMATAVAYTPTEADFGQEIKCGACGMAMTVAEGMSAATFKDKNYYFCNAEEQSAFIAHAEIMLNQSEATSGEDHSGHDHSGSDSAK